MKCVCSVNLETPKITFLASDMGLLETQNFKNRVQNRCCQLNNGSNNEHKTVLQGCKIHISG